MPEPATNSPGVSTSGAAPQSSAESVVSAPAASPAGTAPQVDSSLLQHLDVDPKLLAAFYPPTITTEPTPVVEQEVPVQVESESAEAAPQGEAETPTPEATSEEEDDEQPLSPALQGMKARIDKLTAQKHEAREEAESARRELEQAKAELEKLRAAPAPIAPTPQQPLAHITTPEALQKFENDIEDFRGWALQNLNGGTRLNEKGEEQYYTQEDVGRALAATDKLLRKEVPQRAAYFQARQQYDSDAVRDFPFLADPNSEGSKLTAQFLATVPYPLPDAKIVAAAWAEGELQRRARKAKPAETPKAPEKPKPAPAKAIAPVPLVSSTSAPPLRSQPQQQNAAAIQAARQRLLSNPGDTDALVALLAATT